MSLAYYSFLLLLLLVLTFLSSFFSFTGVAGTFSLEMRSIKTFFLLAIILQGIPFYIKVKKDDRIWSSEEEEEEETVRSGEGDGKK
jgi:hypothetical protein